ncbi:MAG: hypothetical protein CMI70_04740 [Candidatus Pelagibacter sp.]|nr:hypothetical protein [Candidatus Pelagibacter sp.]|tara:strand:+ start:220 stop:675 length:456 start_codon:yes stop_codon:yes gene_type:complete
MTKIRKILTVEQVLSFALSKINDDEVKNISGKTVSHFRKCSDHDDKDHNLYFDDAIKLDILMQKKGLGTPFLDNFGLKLSEEFKKINEFENISNVLINIGGRIGNLMDVTQDAINPAGAQGEIISPTEKDKILKATSEVEEKIAKLKLSVK